MASRRKRISESSPFDKPGAVPPSLADLTDAMLTPSQATSDSPRALVVKDDGSIQTGKFRLSAIGLGIDDTVSQEEWSELGQVLRRLDVALQWLIGDWMVYGERVWGYTYEQVALSFGYEVSTLYNYTSVARKVSFSRRRENLSFGHHQAVASRTPDEQAHWLALAEEEGWSVARLRASLKDSPSSSGHQNPLANQKNRQIFNRVWRSLNRGQAIKPEDIDHLRRWLDAIESRKQP